jgi:hypothetical protein
MINSPLNRLNSAVLLFGGLVTLTVAATKPSDLATAVAASSGLLAGTAAATEVSRKQRDRRAESQKVAKQFTALYAKNTGILVPQELAFETGVDIKRIELFLSSLAETQGGERVETEQGSAFYRFPHPDSILNKLTANATAWAQSQTEGLRAENATLKQQVMTMQSILAQMPTMPVGKPPAPVVPKKENAQESIDPWTKLL